MKILYRTDSYSQQRQKEKPVDVYPVLMAMECEYYRQQGNEVYWNEDTFGIRLDKVITEPEGLDFLSLPAPDRKFTNAFDERYQVYGNYKYHPATHMQVADGCWWGKCNFCVERKKRFLVRPIKEVFEELKNISELGFKEVFDDSGTFPTGEWLRRFCYEKIDYVPNIIMGCNMRIGADVDFKLMKQAGFRMVLFGLESSSQVTLNLINKGINKDDIIQTLKRAAVAGLESHGAFMFGYPWSSKKEELETLNFCYYLLKKGYLKTAQASIYTSKEGKGIDRGYVKKIYEVAKYPEFWYRKIKDIKSSADLKYLFRQIKAGLGG